MRSQPDAKKILRLCWEQSALSMKVGQGCEFPCGLSVIPTDGGSSWFILKRSHLRRFPSEHQDAAERKTIRSSGAEGGLENNS